MPPRSRAKNSWREPGRRRPLSVSANWSVLKGRLNFNNPQQETGRFSLRTDNYGLARDKVRRMEAEATVDTLMTTIHAHPTLYEAVAGRPPFVAPGLASLLRRVLDEPAAPGRVAISARSRAIPRTMARHIEAIVVIVVMGIVLALSAMFIRQPASQATTASAPLASMLRTFASIIACETSG